MDPVAVVVTGLWAMLPAYLPNNVAVLVGGGQPIDAGRSWRGRRLLGDGKTWRGTAGGIMVGVVLAAGLNAIRGPVGTVVGVELPGFPPAVTVALPTGAMLGDLLASGAKRRLGRERGASVPVLDQLDFVIGALVLTVVVAPEWSGTVLSLPVVVTILALTPILHVGTNVLAYALGMKGVPW